MTNATLEPLTAPVVSSPANSLMTAEEFFAKHQHDHVELVRGMVQEMAMPETIHGFLCSQIARFLGNFANEHGLGRVMTNDSFVKRCAGQMSTL